MRRAIPVLVALLVLGPVLGLGPGNTRAAAPPMIVLVLVDDMRATDYQALPQTRKLLAEGGGRPSPTSS